MFTVKSHAAIAFRLFCHHFRLCFSFPSIRQYRYLSYDDCLEDKKGKLSELFCVVFCSVSFDVGVRCFYTMGQFICVIYFVFCAFPLRSGGCQYHCNRLPGKIHLLNDLFNKTLHTHLGHTHSFFLYLLFAWFVF